MSLWCGWILVILVLWSSSSDPLVLGPEEFRFHRNVTIETPDPEGVLPHTNLEVLLEVSTYSIIQSGRLQPLGEDLRFYDPSTEQFVEYWIESGLGTNSTQIWLLIPLMQPRAKLHLRMYYGHSTAPSMSLQWGGGFLAFSSNSGPDRCGPPESGWQVATNVELPLLFYDSKYDGREMGRFLLYGSSFGSTGGHGDGPHIEEHLHMDPGGMAGYPPGTQECFVMSNGGLISVVPSTFGCDGIFSHRHYWDQTLYRDTLPLYSTLPVCMMKTESELSWNFPRGLVGVFFENATNVTLDAGNWVEVPPPDEKRRHIRMSSLDEVLLTGGSETHSHFFDIRITSGSGSLLPSGGANNAYDENIRHHPFELNLPTAEAKSDPPYLGVGLAALDVPFAAPVAGMHLFAQNPEPPLGWIDPGIERPELLSRMLRHTPLSAGVAEVGQIGGEPEHTHVETVSKQLGPSLNSSVGVLAGTGTLSTFVTSTTSHSHGAFAQWLPTESTAPFYSVRMFKRMPSAANASVSLVQVEHFVRCSGVRSNSPAVCRSRGDCIADDKCICTVPNVYGSECGETIGDSAVYSKNSLSSEIVLPYEIDLHGVVSKWDLSSTSMNCSYVVSEIAFLNADDVVNGAAIDSFAPNCIWHLSDDVQTTTSLTLELSPSEVGTLVPKSLSVMPVTDPSDILVVPVTLATRNWTMIIAIPSAIVGFLIVCVSVVTISLLIVFCVWKKKYNVKQSKISRIEAIPDIEILMQESEAVRKGERATFRIDEDLFQLNLGDITLISAIGRGGSGSVVYMATWKNQTVAFKVLLINPYSATLNQDSIDEFEKEVAILSSVHHPNILRFYGCCLRMPRVGIVAEFCENGHLQEFCRKSRKSSKPIAIEEKIRMLHEVASSLTHLHHLELAHRDLKPENILVCASGSTRLTDFGLSKDLGASKKQVSMTQRVGTSCYMAPEVFSGHQYSLSCDSFSFGILIFALLTEKWNVYGEEITSVDSRVAQDPHFRPDWSTFPNLPSWATILAQRCWTADPDARPSFARILRSFSTKKIQSQKNSNTSVEEKIDRTSKGAEELRDDLADDVLVEVVDDDDKRLLLKAIHQVETEGAKTEKEWRLLDWAAQHHVRRALGLRM